MRRTNSSQAKRSDRGRSAGSSRSSSSRGSSKSNQSGRSMSTGAKVALATAAGAAAITAVGLATSKAGRRMSKKVGRKMHDLVDAGKSSMRKSPVMREVVEAGIGTAIGAMLPRHGRGGSAKQDVMMEHVEAMSSPGGRSGLSRNGSRSRLGGARRSRTRKSPRSRPASSRPRSR